MISFEDKANTLVDLVLATMNVPQWDEFKAANDMGMGLAVAWKSDIVTLKPGAEKLIEDTYKMLLEVLSIPDFEPEGHTNHLGQIFDAAVDAGAERIEVSTEGAESGKEGE